MNIDKIIVSIWILAGIAVSCVIGIEVIGGTTGYWLAGFSSFWVVYLFLSMYRPID